MPERRIEVISAITRARVDLDRALARLEVLANDDRERISYSVHALNNYLMVVSNTLQMLRTNLIPKGDREVRRWLDALQQATNLMMSTARGVLTTIPDVRPHLLLEEASLTEIAAGVCQAYRNVARRKQIRITWKSGGQDRVITDRVAAGAVLDNLLSNALKYSDTGSTVAVTMTVGPDEVVCSIRDHGPGLSEKDQKLLYQRGVKLSARPTAGEPSTGFGLAIAKDLSEALDGRLRCTSMLGEGSCFMFSLPLAHASIHGTHELTTSRS